MATTNTTTVGRRRGVSLAKGPAALIGLVLLAFGVTGLIFGSSDFTTQAPDGTVQGGTWLGLEVNGWTNLLCIGAGALLLLAAPLHWGAKTMALIVGAALAAAALVGVADGSDVFGIFAVNGWTELCMGAAGVALMVIAMLPRVGGGRDHVVAGDAAAPGTRTGRFRRDRTADPAAEPVGTRRTGTAGPATADDRTVVGDRGTANDRPVTRG